MATSSSVGVLRTAWMLGVMSSGRARPSVKARVGTWHVAHERCSAPERRESEKRRPPSATSARFGGGAKSGAKAVGSSAWRSNTVAAFARQTRRWA